MVSAISTKCVFIVFNFNSSSTDKAIPSHCSLPSITAIHSVKGISSEGVFPIICTSVLRSILFATTLCQTKQTINPIRKITSTHKISFRPRPTVCSNPWFSISRTRYNQIPCPSIIQISNPNDIRPSICILFFIPSVYRIFFTNLRIFLKFVYIKFTSIFSLYKDAKPMYAKSLSEFAGILLLSDFIQTHILFW